MPRKKTPPKNQTTKNADKLASVLERFNQSWQYTQSSWHSRWQDNYSLYHGNRVKRGYDGITDTFVPMAFSTVETKTSALFGTKPKFNYIPPHDKKDQKTDILNSLLDFYWDKDQWSIKVINWGRSCLMLGTSVVYLFWDIDHPVMINIPIRDFFIDPTATSLENARYMGRRYLTTKEDLESYEIVDPETGEMVKKYTNLDQVKAGAKGDNTDKQEKDMWYGSTVDNAKDNQIEVIELWTEDEVISIANRCALIEDRENYYKSQGKKNGNKHAKGIMPFAGLRDYPDESLFYAKGEVDFMADQQELLNDITNQNVDSVTFALNQMYTLDPKYAHLLNEIENLPGATYLAEAGALNPIAQRDIPPDAFNERMNLKNEIRETTASNEVIKGVGQDSNATATEINAQISGAGQRIGLLVTQIEDEGFHRLAKIVFQMIQLYVTEPMMVRILGKDGARWEEFDPKDFKGDYEPRVQLDITVENKKAQEAADAKEMMAAFLGDPDVNQIELKKLTLAKSFNLEPDEVELLMQPNPVGPMSEAPAEMPMDMPPEMMDGLDSSMMPPEAPMEEPLPEMIIDPQTGVPIDPLTGLPLEIPEGALV